MSGPSPTPTGPSPTRLLPWVLVLLVGLGAALGWSVARHASGGAPALPGPVAALHAHLRAHGVDTDARTTRRGGLAEVRQHVYFSVEGERERVFFVLWCESEAAAQRHLQRLLRAPSPSHPAANGDLVIYLTDWPASDPLTRRVLAAFQSFEAPGR